MESYPVLSGSITPILVAVGHTMPFARTEILEEGSKGRHAGCDKGEIVLDTAGRLMRSRHIERLLRRETTYNRVTTLYCAIVASVVPRACTPKAIRMAHAIEALTTN